MSAAMEVESEGDVVVLIDSQPEANAVSRVEPNEEGVIDLASECVCCPFDGFVL